jgi:uncharacterized hydantoinase/oxoprolinase family protein
MLADKPENNSPTPNGYGINSLPLQKQFLYRTFCDDVEKCNAEQAKELAKQSFRNYLIQQQLTLDMMKKGL